MDLYLPVKYRPVLVLVFVLACSLHEKGLGNVDSVGRRTRPQRLQSELLLSSGLQTWAASQ